MKRGHSIPWIHRWSRYLIVGIALFNCRSTERNAVMVERSIAVNMETAIEESIDAAPFQKTCLIFNSIDYSPD